MSLALYTATAALLLWLVHRHVTPVSRGAAIVLYALPFAFVGIALLAGRIYGPIDLPYATEPLNWMKGKYGIDDLHNGILSDVYCQMIPWRKAVQWSLAHGEWPLWNRFILSGDILAAAAQPAAYSPFTLLACLLPVAHSLTFTAAIAHLVAAIGAFLLARELGCRESAALIASAGWMYSTALALFILWPLGFSWAFFPFVLLGVKRVCATPSVRSIALLTIGFTLLLLAGHPETALHVIVLGAAYGVVQLFAAKEKLRAIGSAAIAGVIALLLCAIYLLPVLEAAPQTMEQPYRTEIFAKQDRGVPLQEVGARLATDFFPYLHPRTWKLEHVRWIPVDSAAVGSIVLALAIFGIWRVRSRESWTFAAIAIFCLLARAEWTPLARALQKLPLLDIALNERFSFGASCALAILAALGAERLLQSRGAALTFTAVLLVIGLGNAYFVNAPILEHALLEWGYYKVAAEVGCLAIAALLLALRIPARYVLPSLLALIVLQRVATDGGLYRTFRARSAYPPIPILQPLKQAQKPFRITGHGLALIPGTGALYELEDVRGYEAMTFARYVETYRAWCTHQPVWFNRVDDLTKPFLSFLNVRYAITWDRDRPPDGWKQIAWQRGSMLLENTRALDRAFVPRFVRLGFNEGETTEAMMSEGDFSERAWIRASLEKHERTNGPGRVTSIRDTNLGYLIAADMQEAGWVVISETAWKGWRAYIDGRRVQMQIANAAFLSVYVPRGKHEVRLKYWPESFVIGRAVSFATLAAICAFAILWRRALKGSQAHRLTGSK
ncbi:MAG TPA: YfhO family protein [Thermoanaerobaculia bacterium]|nr:YfhO family protein [Thermoanaerobaculia bacterium]